MYCIFFLLQKWLHFKCVSFFFILEIPKTFNFQHFLFCKKMNEFSNGSVTLKIYYRYVKSIFVTLKIIQNILFNECILSELFQFLLAIFDLLPPVVGLFRFGALYVIVISQNFVQTVSVPRLEGFSNICSQLWCQSMWTRRYDLEICQEKLSKTQYIY